MRTSQAEEPYTVKYLLLLHIPNLCIYLNLNTNPVSWRDKFFDLATPKMSTSVRFIGHITRILTMSFLF